jgi:hypothetical protein
LTDQDQTAAGRLDLAASAIQLDRVILAVNSAVVSEPDERDRSITPQVAESNVVALVVGQDNIVQIVGPGQSADVRHAPKLTARQTACVRDTGSRSASPRSRERYFRAP